MEMEIFCQTTIAGKCIPGQLVYIYFAYLAEMVITMYVYYVNPILSGSTSSDVLMQQLMSWS